MKKGDYIYIRCCDNRRFMVEFCHRDDDNTIYFNAPEDSECHHCGWKTNKGDNNGCGMGHVEQLSKRELLGMLAAKRLEGIFGDDKYVFGPATIGSYVGDDDNINSIIKGMGILSRAYTPKKGYHPGLYIENESDITGNGMHEKLCIEAGK